MELRPGGVAGGIAAYDSGLIVQIYCMQTSLEKQQQIAASTEHVQTRRLGLGRALKNVPFFIKRHNSPSILIEVVSESRLSGAFFAR